jgi:hypothetical protein
MPVVSSPEHSMSIGARRSVSLDVTHQAVATQDVERSFADLGTDAGQIAVDLISSYRLRAAPVDDGHAGGQLARALDVDRRAAQRQQLGASAAGPRRRPAGSPAAHP